MSRSFNGTSDAIKCSGVDPTGLRSLTGISAWIYPTSSTTDGWIAGEVFSSGELYELRADRSASGFFNYVIVCSGVATVLASTSTVASLLNTWVHLCGTYDGSTQRLYVNGSQQASGAATGTIDFNTSSNFCIGQDTIHTSNTFAGRIADVAVWSTPLTALEVAALSKGIRPPAIRPLSLKGYWPLDGLQSPEPDFSGNANNGTLTGTTSAFGPPFTLFTPRWSELAQFAVAVNKPLPPFNLRAA